MKNTRPWLFELWIPLFLSSGYIKLLDSLSLIQWIALTPFEQPGPGARSGKCYRRRVLRPTCLQDLFFNRGTIQRLLQEFFVRWEGGGGGEGKRVEGGLSRITGCFLNGSKVFFVKNKANSVLSQKSWRSSNICGSTTRRLANLTGLALNERTFASQSEVSFYI